METILINIILTACLVMAMAGITKTNTDESYHRIRKAMNCIGWASLWSIFLSTLILIWI